LAIKVENCQKSLRILDVLSSSHILGASLPKVIPILSLLPHGKSPGKKFCEDTPIGPEVIVAHTLNFKPNCKLSSLKFFGGTPSLLGCALVSLPQSLETKKIEGAAPQKGRNIISQKVHFSGSKLTTRSL